MGEAAALSPPGQFCHKPASVSVDGITHIYHPPGQPPLVALQNVHLDIKPGEFVSLFGPSGCGKTSLLYIMAGFIRPSEGQIRVGNNVVRGPGRDRAMVFQSYALFPWYTVIRNVELGPEIQKVSRKERRERALHYLEMVGLAHAADRYPYELSGGMQQRVALCRAFANYPEVLLMDEPFGALDAQTRNRLQRELREMIERERRTVVFVTHAADEAICLSDRICVLSANPGRIKEVIKVPRQMVSASGGGKSAQFRELSEHLHDLLGSDEELEAEMI